MNTWRFVPRPETRTEKTARTRDEATDAAYGRATQSGGAATMGILETLVIIFLVLWIIGELTVGGTLVNLLLFVAGLLVLVRLLLGKHGDGR
jgi:hypothetical protein